LEAHLFRMLEALLVAVADDHDSRPEDLRRCSRGHTYRPRPGDIHCGSHADTSAFCAMKSSRQNIREHGQITNLLHGLILVGKFEQVEVREWHQNIIRLTSHPAAHVDVAIGAPRLCPVHVEANAGVAVPASPATSA